MGRKRKGRTLEVYVGASRVGLYARAPSGALSFRYDPQWLALTRAFPVSLSMPLSDRTWSGDQVHSYFDGLLPDDQALRDKIAARERAESAGTFDLLAVIGRDCVGALRFVPEGLDPGDPARMTYRPVSDEEIARRVASLGASPLGMSADEEDFRISIAGVQEKTAFLWAEGQWQIPLGTTPTSHIFKPAIKRGPHGADFSDTPWNEWVCLAFCRALGLETARADVHHYDGNPVIVVERFDRQWQDGVLYRLPQEDICQALGVPLLRKYESDGGPGIVDVLAFLNGAASPREDRLSFMKAQIVFWLLAAIDGHAKNFSILLTPGGYKLTPLYDVMSAAPYPALSDHKVKLAMAVGDRRHYRLKEIQPRHFYQTGQKAGLGKRDMDDLFADLLAKVDAALATVAEQAGLAGVPQTTLEPIRDGVKRRIRMIEQ
ncbi:MAG: type II toxin-antitoxin system HipA family toxin [Candidatus Thiodiazotropha sp.]|jgi:serine/threonine-protein kinase HipA